jgi:hypothetical protein
MSVYNRLNQSLTGTNRPQRERQKSLHGGEAITRDDMSATCRSGNLGGTMGGTMRRAQPAHAGAAPSSRKLSTVSTAEMKELDEILRSIFDTRGHRGKYATKISMHELLNFARDTGLLDRRVTAPGIGLIFQKVVLRGQKDLDFRGFQEAVRMIAVTKEVTYQQIIQTAGRPVPKAKTTNEVMLGVFEHYCKLGAAGKLAHDSQFMAGGGGDIALLLSNTNFSKLCKDLGIADTSQMNSALCTRIDMTDCDMLFAKHKGKGGNSVSYPVFIAMALDMAEISYGQDHNGNKTAAFGSFVSNHVFKLSCVEMRAGTPEQHAEPGAAANEADDFAEADGGGGGDSGDGAGGDGGGGAAAAGAEGGYGGGDGGSAAHEVEAEAEAEAEAEEAGPPPALAPPRPPPPRPPPAAAAAAAKPKRAPPPRPPPQR